MPIIKSAIERVRTSEKAEARNASQLSQMRTAIKKIRQSLLAQITLTTYTRLLSQQLTVPTLRALSRLTRLHVTRHVSQHVTLSNEKATIKLVAFFIFNFSQKEDKKANFLILFLYLMPLCSAENTVT